MNKKVLVIVFCVIVCLAGLTYAYKAINNNKPVDMNISTPENSDTSNIEENKEQTRDNNVIITQQEPVKSQKRGTVVQVHYTITNKGKNTIHDVLIISNNGLFKKSMGVLKPGETKGGIYTLYIPSDEDEFCELNLPNPWEAGVIHATFNDEKNVIHKVTSNSIKIKWHNK